MQNKNSCIYTGQVWHQRHIPILHGFRYSLFMMYLDLDELPSLFDSFSFWSLERFNLASFYRKDYADGKQVSLTKTIRDMIQKETGKISTGPIRLLTHLRYFGIIFNPVSFYYCFDENGTRLEFIVAEITNTPWGERHSYVLDCIDSQSPHAFFFQKNFHVSPFMPMQMIYQWNLDMPHEKLSIHMENFKEGNKHFEASMQLTRLEINHRNLSKVIIHYPLMTIKVIWAIYWQAMKLWLKGSPFYSHPNSTNDKK
jgi:uncharacterized protein